MQIQSSSSGGLSETPGSVFGFIYIHFTPQLKLFEKLSITSQVCFNMGK